MASTLQATQANIKKQIMIDERRLDLMRLKLQLLGHKRLAGSISTSQHETWLTHNPDWRAACVKTMANDPLAKFPLWPVFYKGIVWSPAPHGSDMLVNGLAVKSVLQLSDSDELVAKIALELGDQRKG